MASEDAERLHAFIPKRLKEKLRETDGTQAEAVVEALEIYFGEEGADSRAAIERQIQRLREQKAKAKQRKQTAEEQIAEAEGSIERLQARLAAIERTNESYEEALDTQIQSLRESRTSIFVDHPSAQRLAREHNRSQEEVINDLRERSDLDASYFTEGPPDDAGRQQDVLNSVGGGSE